MPAAASPPALAALLDHARALVGAPLGDIADGLGLPVPAGRVRSKGWAGQIIEQELGLSTGGASGPDFPDLGVELKTVPVDAAGRPLESTAVCQIDPVAVAGESWETSTVRRKLTRVLWIALLVPPGANSVGERQVARVRLWQPSAGEEALLRTDFEEVVRGYFRRGRLAELTAHVGTVLQVRPKGRNAADTRAAFGPDGRPVRLGKCGFYLRSSFVASILAAA